jgi:hypothetical protein
MRNTTTITMAPRAGSTSPPGLLSVIAALGAAEEGSEYLDYAIHRQFGLTNPVAPYTRSIDAAMLLFPAGWSIHRLCRRHDCHGNFAGWLAELYRATAVVVEFPSSSLKATAPLALCFATIRIHEAQITQAHAGEAAAEKVEKRQSLQTA